MTLFGFTLSTTELLVLTVAAGWIFSALSYALPTPKASSSTFYVVLYRLVHFAAANLNKLRPAAVEEPKDPSKAA